MIVSVDTETELIERGVLAPRIVCMSYESDTGMRGLVHAQLEPERIRELLNAWLTDESTTIVGANFAYDVGVFLENDFSLAPLFFGAYEQGRVIDIQIQEQLADIERGQSLKRSYALSELEKRYGIADRTAQKTGPDIWRLRYSELIDTPIEEWPPEAIEYALDDAKGALEVYLLQRKIEDAKRQSCAALALHLMTAWGVHTDADRIDAFEQSARAKYEELTETLLDAGLLRRGKIKGKEKLIRNTKKAKALAFECAKEAKKELPFTKKGVETFKRQSFEPARLEQEYGKDALLGSLSFEEMTELKMSYVSLSEDACSALPDPVLQAYGERTSVATDVETRIPRLRAGVIGGPPLQPQYVTLVETGRTSCRQGKYGFQVQNPPRSGPVRECFVARPGYLFVDCDFDTLELRTLAQVCMTLFGKSKLAEALNAGIDPHLLVASQLLEIDFEIAKQRKHESEVKNARQLAKPANFGFPGGMQPPAFVDYARGYGVEIELEKSKWIHTTWKKTWPEMREYFAYISNACNLAGKIEQPFSGRVRSLKSYTSACNTLFQGAGSDAGKSALWFVSRACYDESRESVLYGARPVMFVHDQIIAEVREDIAHEQAKELERLMIEGANCFLPDVPATCSAALSKHWCKGTEPVFDKNGRLRPWDVMRDARALCYREDGSEVAWD